MAEKHECDKKLSEQEIQEMIKQGKVPDPGLEGKKLKKVDWLS